MTYPDTAGYQKHSETSIEAAENLQGADTLRHAIHHAVKCSTNRGRTSDELSEYFDIPASTIGARVRELELKGNLIKTAMKRKTRYKRNAFVYVVPMHFKPEMGRSTIKEKPKDIMLIEQEHHRMKQALIDIITQVDKLNDIYDIRNTAEAALDG